MQKSLDTVMVRDIDTTMAKNIDAVMVKNLNKVEHRLKITGELLLNLIYCSFIDDIKVSNEIASCIISNINEINEDLMSISQLPKVL